MRTEFFREFFARMSLALLFSFLGCDTFLVARGENLPQRAPAEHLKVEDLLPSSFLAAYRLEVQGVTVGYALLGQNLGNLPGPEKTKLFLWEAFGEALTLHEVELDLSSESSHEATLQSRYRHLVEGQILAEYHHAWELEDGKASVRRGPTTEFFRVSTPGVKAKEGQLTGVSLPFYRPPEEPDSNVILFDPFAQGLGTAEAFQAEFDRDGFARSLVLQLKEGVPVHFVRISRNEWEQTVHDALSQALDLELYRTREREPEGLEKLDLAARKCSSEFAEALRQTSRKNPYMPYLLYKKLDVMRDFCEGTREFVATLRHQRAPAVRLQSLIDNVRKPLSVHELEIPASMIASPEWPLIFADGLDRFWVESLSRLIIKGTAELEDTLALEVERKRRSKVRVAVEGRALGTVFKGVIKSRHSGIEVTLNTAKDPAVQFESWKELPVLFASNGGTLEPSLASENQSETLPQLPFRLFDGRVFASLTRDGISDVCRAFAGKVGLDLGNGSHRLIRHPEIRGDWGAASRLRILELFLRKAASSPACRQLVVRVPASMRAEARRVVDHFESSVVQVEQEIQLKNAKFRPLRLLPGRYEIFVNSLVSSELLERREFEIEDVDKMQKITVRF